MEEYVDPELDLEELEAENANRAASRADTIDRDPEDEILQGLLRRDDGMGNEHGS